MKAYFLLLGGFLVKLGKSLMLSIAILPVAGILLRLGQPDMISDEIKAAMKGGPAQ